jgi:hypothetical protein
MASASDGLNNHWGQWKIRRGRKGHPVALDRVALEEGTTFGGPYENLLGGRA